MNATTFHSAAIRLAEELAYEYDNLEIQLKRFQGKLEILELRLRATESDSVADRLESQIQAVGLQILMVEEQMKEYDALVAGFRS